MTSFLENLNRYEKDKRLHELCLSYMQSYSRNAEQLLAGNKHLTFENLKKEY